MNKIIKSTQNYSELYLISTSTENVDLDSRDDGSKKNT